MNRSGIPGWIELEGARGEKIMLVATAVTGVQDVHPDNQALVNGAQSFVTVTGSPTWLGVKESVADVVGAVMAATA